MFILAFMFTSAPQCISHSYRKSLNINKEPVTSAICYDTYILFVYIYFVCIKYYCSWHAEEVIVLCLGYKWTITCCLSVTNEFIESDSYLSWELNFYHFMKKTQGQTCSRKFPELVQAACFVLLLKDAVLFLIFIAYIHPPPLYQKKKTCAQRDL